MSAEETKAKSAYLAGTIEAELVNDHSNFSDDAELLLKFHGIYQQDARDVRRERKLNKEPLDYSCMVRVSVPGGAISSEQWLALDRVADIAGGALRLTTRQGVQYHVVYKGYLAELVAAINATGLTTLGACGDVVRNVMGCPLPHPERESVIQPIIDDLVERFRPSTPTYWELWVNGEPAVTASENPRPRALSSIDSVEPIYGATYLPRKFKIGIAWPGDNCIDVYTHDIGIVPTLAEGRTGGLTGFVILAGGGMGMSHNRPEDTYPLLAQPVCWVSPEQLGGVVEAIVTTQRDHGNREDRSRARLKYLLEESGVAWLRSQIAQRTGYEISDPLPLLPWQVEAHHGHHHISGDTCTSGEALGIPVPSGRITGALRSELRRLVEHGVVSELRVTPRQDLLLLGLRNRENVESELRRSGVALAIDQTPVRNLAIACPALPTCSKALGEAERVLPDLIARVEEVLEATGNPDLGLRINMTGCPNGCTRPYAAEIGIVGRTKRSYDVYVGGSPAGDRLAQCLRTDVHLDDVPQLIQTLVERFNTTALAGESFGDWTMRHNWEALITLLPEPTGRRRKSRTTPVSS